MLLIWSDLKEKMLEEEEHPDEDPLVHWTSGRKCTITVRRNIIITLLCCVLLLSAIPVTWGNGASEGKASRNTPAELYVLSEEEANKTGAYCLDGSPPAYYFRKGAGNSSWIVWLQGGGACSDLNACHLWTFSDFGSSKRLHNTSTFNGILSADKNVNPDFYTWNAVTLVYCDGFFFAGNRRDVVKHNFRSLYFRGRRNLNTLIVHLLQAGMGKADRVILGGSSAGAIGTLWASDDVIALLPNSADVKILSDSGMFMNIPDKDGIYSLNKTYTAAVDLHNGTRSTNKNCQKVQAPSEHWKCYYPENLVPFEPVPIFIMNCLYDNVALNNIVKTTCRPDQCQGKDLVAVQNYRRTMLKVAGTNLREKDGAFLITCFFHGYSWTGYKVNGISVRQAVGDWYFGRTSDNFHADMGTELNPTCKQGVSNDTRVQSIWHRILILPTVVLLLLHA